MFIVIYTVFTTFKFCEQNYLCDFSIDCVLFVFRDWQQSFLDFSLSVCVFELTL